MNRDQSTAQRQLRQPRKWLRRMVACFLLFCTTLALINGPIARWAIPRIARHYAAKSGLELKLRVSGNLSHGLALHDLSAIGGPIKTLRIDLIAPQYHWRDAMKGKVAGLKIEGLSVQYDLEKSFAHSEKKPRSKEFSLEEIFQPLRQAAVTLRSYDLHVQAEQLEILRGARSLLQIHQLHLDHNAGSDDWSIRSQAQQVPSLPPFPPQQTVLRWTDRELSLERWNVRPDLRIENLLLRYPQSAMPSVGAKIVIDESTWNIRSSSKSSQLSVRLAEGRLKTATLENLCGIKTPIRGVIDNLELLAEFPNFSVENPDSWSSLEIDGSLQISASQLTDASSGQWTAEKVTLQFRKKSQTWEAKLNTTGHGAEAEFSVNGNWPHMPTTISSLSNMNLSYQGKLTAADALLHHAWTNKSQNPVDPQHPIPSMSLNWNGSCQIQDGSIEALKGTAVIDFLEENAIDLTLRYDSDTLDKWNYALEIPALQITGHYQISTQEYQSTLRCQKFDVTPWQSKVSWLGIDLPRIADIDLQGTCQGQLKDHTHQGKFSLANLTWQRTKETIQAKGQFDYQWPQSARLNDVELQLDNQRLKLDAAYQDSSLTISRLEHFEKDQQLLEASAQLPFPMDIRSLEEYLLQEEPWKLELQTKNLSVSMINRWLPAASPLPLEGSAELSFKIFGTPAQPQFALETRWQKIRHLQHSNWPAVDLQASITGENHQLQLRSKIVAERLSPLSLDGSMPFRPREWVQDAAMLMKENFDAELLLPSSDLAAWQSFFPTFTELSGQARAVCKASGTLAEPQFHGEISLTDCAAKPIEKTIPPWRNGKMLLKFHDRSAQLENLSMELAGGTLQVSGRADFPKNQKPLLDFSLIGKELPVWRSSAIISRANANLSLRGNWDLAKVDGSIGFVDSLLYKDFEIIPYGKPLALRKASELPALDHKVDDVAMALPEPFANWPVNVAIKTQDPFLIRGNLASGQVDLDFRLQGTLGNPQPTGQAKIRDLLATLPLSRLEVPSGQIRFEPKGGLDPVLDLRGVSRVANYDINLYLYGKCSAPRILLTSTPPLPDHEIMTLLATGTTTKGLSDGSMAQSRALQLLMEEFRRGRLPLGRKLAPFLERIDDVELAVGQPDPYSGRKRSSVQLPFAQHWSLFGGVDGEGKTRNLLLFQVKFR